MMKKRSNIKTIFLQNMDNIVIKNKGVLGNLGEMIETQFRAL